MAGIEEPGAAPGRKLRRRHALTRQREERAWQLNAEGLPHRAIAERLAAEGLGSVSQPAVSKMIRRVESRALSRMTALVEGRKAVQAARLEVIFQESLAGWRRSQEDAKTARRKTVDGEVPEFGEDGDPVPGTGHPGREERTVELRGRSGDAAFLKTALQALADERKLWGLEAPQRRELSGPGGAPMEVADATPETVERRMARMRRLSPEQRSAYLEAIEAMLRDDEPPEADDDDSLLATEPPEAPGGA